MTEEQVGTLVLSAVAALGLINVTGYLLLRWYERRARREAEAVQPNTQEGEW